MRNVVLICLDTVRKDFFDRFAPRLQDRTDVQYTQCRAASSWSAPSHASMFTGTLPHQHGVHTYNRDFSGLSRADTFFGDLPDHRALGASANVWAGSSFGFDGLFDDFSDISPDRRFPDGIDVARFGQECEQEGIRRQAAFLRAAFGHDHPLQSLANGALVQLDDSLARAPIPKLLDDGAKTLLGEATKQVRRTEGPFVQFLNLMDAHGPLHHVYGYDSGLHDAPYAWTSSDVDWRDALEAGDDEQLARYYDLYGAAIDYLDRKVVAFVEEVSELTDKETTVVVTSDHGDNFGTETDEGRWGHTKSSLSEGLLHVPLLVLNAPESLGEVDGYVSHLRLGELVVGLANEEVPDVTDERIPAERIGSSSKLHKLSELSPDEHRMVRCVYDGENKYEWDSLGERRRFDLDAERPNWQRPAGDTAPVEDLEAAFFDEPLLDYFERVSEGATETPSMDEATRDRLQDLGYL